MGGKVDERNWRMVRLRPETVAKLRDIGHMWQRLYEAGKGELGNPDGKEPSLDYIIQELIARDEAHRARGRRARLPLEDWMGSVGEDIVEAEDNAS